MTAYEATMQSLAAASEKLQKLRDELLDLGRKDLADLAWSAGVNISHAVGKVAIAHSRSAVQP